MSERNRQKDTLESLTRETSLTDEVLDHVSGGNLDVNGQGGLDVIIGSTGLVGIDTKEPADLTDDTEGGTSESGINVSLGDGSVRTVRY